MSSWHHCQAQIKQKIPVFSLMLYANTSVIMLKEGA